MVAITGQFGTTVPFTGTESPTTPKYNPKDAGAPSAHPDVNGLNPGNIIGGKNAWVGVDDLLRSNKPLGDTNYSISAGWTPDKTPATKDETPLDVAKKKKNDENSDKGKTTNPSAGPADKSLNILQAKMQVDPNNTVGAVQKALHAMMMITMVDQLTSPTGVNNMTAGAITGALQSIAASAGTQNVLSVLSSAMPILATQLNSSNKTIINQALVGLLTNTPQGALHPTAVAAAQQTASAIASAVGTGNSLNGATLGLNPTSLAAKIASLAPGSTITSTAVLGDPVLVTTTVTTGPTASPAATAPMPSLTGMEAVNIATAAIPTAVAALAPVVSSAAASNPSAVAAGLVSALSAVSGQVIDAGLTALLGTGLAGLLGAVTTILPQFAGLIAGAAPALSNLQLNSGAMNSLLSDATRTLGLTNQIHVLSNIFSSHPSEQDADVASAAADNAAATGQQTDVTTANGTDVSASPSADVPQYNANDLALAQQAAPQDGQAPPTLGV